MEYSPFIDDFSRIIRGMDPAHRTVLKSREPFCIQALIACRNNSRADVHKALDQFANRQITDDAEWVYDDFLLFTFLCAYIQFSDFGDIIDKLVKFRRQSEQSKKCGFLQEAERIAQTKNLISRSMFSVVIARMLECPMADQDSLRAAYNEAVSVSLEERKSAFEATIAARCQEVVAELSITSSMPASIIVRHFWKRCKRIAAFLTYISISVVAVGTIWLIWLYFFGDEENSSFAEKLLAIGASGLLVWFLGCREKMKKWLAYVIVWMLSGRRGRATMIELNKGEL